MAATLDWNDFGRPIKVVGGEELAVSSSDTMLDPICSEDVFTAGVDASAQGSVGEIRDCVACPRRGGRWSSARQLPYGFARQYEVVGGKRRLVEQVIDEQQAAVIREAARRVLDGEAPYAIARDFNARGIPAPPRRFVGSDPGETNRHLANRAASSIATQEGPEVTVPGLHVDRCRMNPPLPARCADTRGACHDCKLIPGAGLNSAVECVPTSAIRTPG